jgi:mono/diheme cytochrome c family protein
LKQAAYSEYSRIPIRENLKDQSTMCMSARAAVVCACMTAATLAADTTNGERLARRWCASCHVVAADQKGASADAPAFSTIARRPGFDRNKVAFFLLDPHPKMPDMSLSRNEAADLAVYIASLAAN